MVMARVLISDSNEFQQQHDHEASIATNTVIRAVINNP